MTTEELNKWMTHYAKLNMFLDSKDKNGEYNGFKVLIGSDGKNMLFRRCTFTMDIFWPAPLGYSPIIKRHEFWLEN